MPAWAASVQSLNGSGGRTRIDQGGPPRGGLVAGLIGIGRDEPRGGGQHHPEGRRVGSGRCRSQRHDSGQLPEGLTKQEGVKLPLADDQRAAGLDGGEGRIDPRAVAIRFGVLRFAPLGVADLHEGQPVPVEPRDNHPSDLKAAVPLPGRDHHAGRPPEAGGLDRLIGQTAIVEIGQGLGLPRASRGGRRPRSQGPGHRPGASRTVPLAAGWRPSAGLLAVGLAGGRGRGLPPEGATMPDSSAMIRTASGNATLLIRITRLAASPCSPHP